MSRLRIGPGFILLLSVFIYFDKESLLPVILLSILFHELGHYIAIRLSGGKIKRLSLTLIGAALEFDSSAMSYVTEVRAALAGPAVSLITAWLASFAGKFTQWSWLNTFAGISLVFGLFNLLPIFPLDGGRALYYALLDRFPVETADRIRLFIGMLMALLLLCAGFYLAMLGNIYLSLILLSFWLIKSTITPI